MIQVHELDTDPILRNGLFFSRVDSSEASEDSALGQHWNRVTINAGDVFSNRSGCSV